MSKTILVNILILFFIILIGYQIILANRIVEGLENNANATNANATNANTYTPYDTNNPDNALILSQKNAGNIDYLKQRIDNVQDIFQEVQDLSANVSALQEQVNGIISAQADYATQMTGGTTPVITGAINEDDEEDTTTLETTS
jgi:methyl-accepting chemotaxis protein